MNIKYKSEPEPEPEPLRDDTELEEEGQAELEGRILSDFQDWRDECDVDAARADEAERSLMLEEGHQYWAAMAADSERSTDDRECRI